MSYTKAQLTVPQREDANGNPASGYTISSYIWDTSTPTPMYTSSAGAGSATSFTLNSLGEPQTAGGTACDIFLDTSVTYKIIIRDAGGVQVGPTVGPVKPSDGTATTITFLQSGTGAVERDANAKMGERLTLADYYEAGELTHDAAWSRAYAEALASGRALLVGAGEWVFASQIAIDDDRVVIRGDGSDVTVMRFTGTGDFVLLGNTSAFRQGVNLYGMTLEGNSSCSTIIKARAIARSQWEDINVREANASTGVGIKLQGCMLNRFTSVMCSQDRNAMNNAPSEGLQIEALSPFGNSSNNIFEHCYFEGDGSSSGLEFGIRISGGTQNVFIGGSPESCYVYGLLIGANCNYNTFIGTGFENATATQADVSDGGNYTKFINCYAAKSIVLQGRGGQISGGFYERIQIDVAGVRNRVEDVTINHWATGSGGYYDSGNRTTWRNIYDSDLADYIYPQTARIAMTVAGSPFIWINDTATLAAIIVVGGTITAITITRNAVAIDIPIPANSYTIVAPGDRIQISWSASPSNIYQYRLSGV